MTRHTVNIEEGRRLLARLEHGNGPGDSWLDEWSDWAQDNAEDLINEVARWRQDAGLSAPVGFGMEDLYEAEKLLRKAAEAKLEKLKNLEGLPKTKEEIKEILQGSYTEKGMDLWFERSRAWLGCRSPQQVLDDYEALMVHVKQLQGPGLAT
jgi:hypothetical protein